MFRQTNCIFFYKFDASELKKKFWICARVLSLKWGSQKPGRKNIDGNFFRLVITLSKEYFILKKNLDWKIDLSSNNYPGGTELENHCQT